MPLIESDVLPRYDPDEVAVVAIHSFPDSRGAAGHLQQYGLSFPLALDLDSELFRRFRLPDHVFPLNVVLDREGRVAHIGVDLDEAVAAVDALLQ